MTISICKFLSISLNTSQRFHKPPLAYSLFQLFLSTSVSQGTEQKITVFDYLVTQQHFSAESASNVPSSATKYLKKPQNTDSVFNFLKEIGFSKTNIEQVVQQVPRVLSADLEKIIKPKFKMFKDLGINSSDVVEIISANPWILTRSADNRIAPSILVLKNVLGSEANVSALLKISGWFLGVDLERVMLPNIEYLKSCGISSSQIVQFVYNFPRFFLLNPDSIKGYVKRVDEMGVDRKSKQFISAVRVVSSMTIENWEHKLKVLKEMGFSEEDILFLMRRVPQSLAVSERKIKQVTQLLLSYPGTDMTFITSHPELFICSVNQRLKPRFEVLKVLESKKLISKKPSLIMLCKISNTRFLHKFVIPYSNELENCWAARLFQVNSS